MKLWFLLQHTQNTTKVENVMHNSSALCGQLCLSIPASWALEKYPCVRTMHMHEQTQDQ